MAATNFTPISLYYSSTASAVPLAADLVAGELAINTNDGKLYYKNSSNVVTLLASTAGSSGDVVGPASATDNAVARFDLTTGKLIQNSVVTIADTTGNMAGVGTLSSGAITSSSLTATRVPYAGTAGLIQDSANMTFSGTVLTSSFAGPVAATTLSASSTVSGTGFSTYLASPPAIGGAAAAAGTFTAIVGTSVTDSGLTTGRVTYASTGGLLTDSSAFTFNGTTLTVTEIGSTRVNPRTSSTASTATLTPDISSNDQYNLTAQAVALAVAAPIGTPVDGNKIIIRILDNGTSRAITWNATYTAIGSTLPTATAVSKMTYVGCIYNAANTRWDVVAVATQV